MTASWLKRMGWREVFVLVATGTETATPVPPVLGGAPAAAPSLDPPALAARLARGEVVVVDLAPSRRYREGHIPGAWFAIRSRLDAALAAIAPARELVLTSEDGALAGFAAAEAAALTPLPVRVLAGGNAAWAAAGYPLTADAAKFAVAPADTWLKPYERPSDIAAAARDYLAWETALLDRLARDVSCRFL